MSFTTYIFKLVALALQKTATKFKIAYNEINIIVYYLLIPLTWTIMFDIYLKSPITTSCLIFMWIGIKLGTYGRFREWCDWVFMISVNFLNFFNRFGGNYVLNSVIICVIIPILIYIGLILLLVL